MTTPWQAALSQVRADHSGDPAGTICAHGACDVQPREPGGAGR